MSQGGTSTSDGKQLKRETGAVERRVGRNAGNENESRKKCWNENESLI